MLKKSVTPAAAIIGMAVAGFATMSQHHGVGPIVGQVVVGVVVAFFAQKLIDRAD